MRGNQRLNLCKHLGSFHFDFQSTGSNNKWTGAEQLYLWVKAGGAVVRQELPPPQHELLGPVCTVSLGVWHPGEKNNKKKTSDLGLISFFHCMNADSALLFVQSTDFWFLKLVYFSKYSPLFTNNFPIQIHWDPFNSFRDIILLLLTSPYLLQAKLLLWANFLFF